MDHEETTDKQLKILKLKMEEEREILKLQLLEAKATKEELTRLTEIIGNGCDYKIGVLCETQIVFDYFMKSLFEYCRKGEAKRTGHNRYVIDNITYVFISGLIQMLDKTHHRIISLRSTRMAHSPKFIGMNEEAKARQAHIRRAGDMENFTVLFL